MAFRLNKRLEVAVFSAGGVPACLCTAGAMPALELIADIAEFRAIWGNSGSVAPLAFKAAGMKNRWIVTKFLQYDFDQLFPRRQGSWQLWREVIREIIRCELTGATMQTGLRDSAPYGYRIDKHIKDWPLNLKVAATSRQNDIVFEAQGMFEHAPGKPKRMISEVPPSVGDAARASATIPGVMKPIEICGLVMQDGALNRHSRCPTTLAMLHDGTDPENIIALAAPKADSRIENWKMNIARHLAGNNQKVLEQHAALMVKPSVANIRTLDFSMNHDVKEAIVLSGFHSTVQGACEAGYIDSAFASNLIAATQTVDGLLEWIDKREASFFEV